MAKPRHLSRAPITEAVIDFRARIPAELDIQLFAALAERLGEIDGAPAEINLLEFGVLQIAGKKPESKQIDHGQLGYRYASKDGKQIAQFRKDGFTFSRLAPYTHWEDVFAEASRLYRVFVEIGQPEEITRIAVRYINRLLLPESEVGDFSPFLTAPPLLPQGINAFMTGFLTQVQVQDPESPIAGTVTQTIQQGTSEPGKVPVILDLDMYEAGNKSPSPNLLLERFAALRELKNTYFFASLTEKAIDLFV